MMYRDAVQPVKMIQIIADLTMSNKATVREFLGLPEKQPSKRKYKKGKSVDKELAQTLYEKGFCDGDIAAELGVSKSAVARWRNNNGLPPNLKIKRGDTGG